MSTETIGRTGDTDAESMAQQEADILDQESQGGPPQGSQDTEPESTDETIPQGVVFDILRNERRRRVLKYLDEQDGRATLGEMAERLAAVENDKPESQITSQERKRLYVGLYQCHLPRMDESGAIDFDGDRGTIETTEHTASFLDHLPNDDADDARDSRWVTYYFTIAAVGAGLLTLNVAGGFGGIAGAQILLGGVVAAVGLCAGLHWYTTAGDAASESDSA
ncbi:DUF7344 domain-containing protein [Halobellus ordinarius]|uniref:DUF7344 domain-containing protein n=1 Tax=Halobellus ordinarius TaxID=3075120 RepID=UPI0028802890|nr:hypothetical protein [Halobellus sp. ZY16]